MSTHIHIQSTITSKGQVTIPKAIRDALSLQTGDKIAFVVQGDDVSISKSPDLLELAGSVKVPPGMRGKPFSEIRATARKARTSR